MARGKLFQQLTRARLHKIIALHQKETRQEGTWLGVWKECRRKSLVHGRYAITCGWWCVLLLLFVRSALFYFYSRVVIQTKANGVNPSPFPKREKQFRQSHLDDILPEKNTPSFFPTNVPSVFIHFYIYSSFTGFFTCNLPKVSSIPFGFSKQQRRWWAQFRHPSFASSYISF